MKRILISVALAALATVAASAETEDQLVASQRPATEAEIATVMALTSAKMRSPDYPYDISISAVMTGNDAMMGPNHLRGEPYHVVCLAGTPTREPEISAGKQAIMIVLDQHGAFLNSSVADLETHFCRRVAWRDIPK